jgi:hypothetical protein
MNISQAASLLIICFLFSAFVCGSELSPQDFQSRYSAEAKKLIALYENVHMKTQLVETYGGKEGKNAKGTFDLEYAQNKEQIKVITTYISGDRMNFSDDVTVRVAAPEKSFVLSRPPAARDLSASFIGHVDNVEQKKIIGAYECGLPCIPYHLLGMPIVEFLAKKDTIIKSVVEKKDLGKDIIQIQFCFEPQPKLKKWFDRADGQFSFDPARLWALRSYDYKYMEKNENQVGMRRVGTLDYDESNKDIPALKSLQENVFGEQERLVWSYHLDVKSIEFGHVSPEEFTLRGCGLPEFESKPSRWLRILLWSVTIVFIALILIVRLRRRRTNPQGE